MAADDMALQLVTYLQCTFEIQSLAGCPAILSDIRFRDRLGRDIHVEPVIALGDHGQANTVTGDRGTDIDMFHIIIATDPRPHISAQFDLSDIADIGDNAGKHPSLLTLAYSATRILKSPAQDHLKGVMAAKLRTYLDSLPVFAGNVAVTMRYRPRIEYNTFFVVIFF